MGKIKINKTITEEVEYLPCLKCGSQNIEFECKVHVSAVGRCIECKNEVKIDSRNFEIKMETLIEQWNRFNNLTYLSSEEMLETVATENMININQMVTTKRLVNIAMHRYAKQEVERRFKKQNEMLLEFCRVNCDRFQLVRVEQAQTLIDKFLNPIK